MIIHRLTYEIIDSQHPNDHNRPTITTQKAISEGDMTNLQPHIIPLLLADVQGELLGNMNNAMEQLNYQMTKTPDEIHCQSVNRDPFMVDNVILTDNLRNIINL